MISEILVKHQKEILEIIVLLYFVVVSIILYYKFKKRERFLQIPALSIGIYLVLLHSTFKRTLLLILGLLFVILSILIFYLSKNEDFLDKENVKEFKELRKKHFKFTLFLLFIGALIHYLGVYIIKTGLFERLLIE